MARARACSIALIGSLLLLVASAQASIYTLTGDMTIEYINTQMGGELRVYDKVFSEFSVTNNSLNGGLAPDASAISVAGVWWDKNGNGIKDVLGDEFGLRFTSLWSAINNQLADTVIRYKVTVDAPYLITDNTLWLSNGGASNGGLVSIDEKVYDVPGPAESIGDKRVYYISPTDKKTLDHIDLPGGYAQLWINKDVGANGGGAGNATISEFYQTFSQVPEPAALALLLAGGATVLIRRRLR